jgi:hypothetical protein
MVLDCCTIANTCVYALPSSVVAITVSLVALVKVKNISSSPRKRQKF